MDDEPQLDEETRRYAEIIRAKQDRLFILDTQAAKYGMDTPPHIAMERLSLEAELRGAEAALDSPIRASFSDELGVRGRFVVNHQQNLDIKKQNREIKQSIAAVVVKLDRFIKDSESWRDMHRQLILIIGIAVIVILLAMAIVGTYLLTKGAL
jgi:hypothetical protein